MKLLYTLSSKLYEIPRSKFITVPMVPCWLKTDCILLLTAVYLGSGFETSFPTVTCVRFSSCSPCSFCKWAINRQMQGCEACADIWKEWCHASTALLVWGRFSRVRWFTFQTLGGNLASNLIRLLPTSFNVLHILYLRNSLESVQNPLARKTNI